MFVEIVAQHDGVELPGREELFGVGVDGGEVAGGGADAADFIQLSEVGVAQGAHPYVEPGTVYRLCAGPAASAAEDPDIQAHRYHLRCDVPDPEIRKKKTPPGPVPPGGETGLAYPTGFEPATSRVGVLRAIQLSHG